MNSITEKTYMLVITEHVEECTICYLHKLSDKRNDLFIEVLCVGGSV